MTDQKNYTQKDFNNFAVNASRLMMAQVLQGQTAYQGNRNYYQVLGYPLAIEFSDYLQRYTRQDIAKRIVDLPAIDTWKEPPALSEGDDENTDTAFVQEFKTLNKRVKVWSSLSEVDRLSGIGTFGVLLIGFKDGGELYEPLNIGKLKGQKGVLYLQAFSEGAVEIGEKEKDAQSPRFGLPENYKITFDENEQAKVVHWSRILHVAEGGRIYGTPRLEIVYNLFDDKMKVVGGTAEATWLNMRPGMTASPKDEYSWDEEEWLTAVNNYAHDPLRMFKAIGLDVEPIGASEVADPTGPHKVVIADMAAAANMPQRILIGSAGGDLSAAKEDTRQWATTIVSRQLNYAEPDILRPFIDRLVELQVLPTPAGGPGAYNVGTLQKNGDYKWPSIIELDDVEKAQVSQSMASAASSLASIQGDVLLDDDEKRAILELPPREPTDEERAMDITEIVAQNLHDGTIDASEVAALMATEYLEGRGEFDDA